MTSEILFGVLFLLVGYGFGCFSTGYFVGRMNGRDIRAEGSGNIGTTNALRTMGAKGGGITFAGDLLKAFIPTLAVRFIFCANMGYEADLTYLMTLLVGLGVVIGHNFPFYLDFKGGKGIAVSAAVIVASSSDSKLGWIMIGIGLVVFILVVAVTRYVSLGSLIVVWFFPIYTIAHQRDSRYFPILLVVSLIFTALAYIKHAGNIKRLMNGTERKLGEKKVKENE
ncbi:MAG: glycerol-3-phosphate 1-O-acyltransferase PlsY [Lachnospiraceae bacterium]|nr:glycerol-3-phosphate 1-O-acyltransferase PlsY [Lachnospiraceae bacterium]